MTRFPHFRLYINGSWHNSSDGRQIKSLNPATGQVWANIEVAGAEETNFAVASAKEAFENGAWAKMLPTERGKLLIKLGKLIEEKKDELARLETLDTGKIIRETTSQIGYSAEFFYYYAGLADKIEGIVYPADKKDMHVFGLREPLGVVVAIVPWNSQLFLTAAKLGPALAAGNTVVLKTSEMGCAPLMKFAELVDQAGFPPGVINIITGYGEDCGKLLSSHQDVSRVAFTGGPMTAKHIVKNTAENFAITTLELGGKSPIMIFSDANRENTVNGVIAGIFAASGQSCVAGSRVYIEEKIFDSIIDEIATRIQKIKIGNPSDMSTEMGPLATTQQLEKIKSLVSKSIEQGAQLITGGKTPENLESPFNQGFYYEPTILQCPNNNIATVEEELFGPVLSAVSFQSEEEAIQLANDSKYGLGSGLFTQDVSRVHRIAKKIKSGILWVNTYRVISPVVPFGGIKLSGMGRESGLESVYDYTRTKSVWINYSDNPMPDPFVMR